MYVILFFTKPNVLKQAKCSADSARKLLELERWAHLKLTHQSSFPPSRQATLRVSKAMKYTPGDARTKAVFPRSDTGCDPWNVPDAQSL